MVQKRIPFSSDQLNEIIKTHPTPFHIYDEQAILDNARRFKAAFAWNEGFKEYFAVKATPNPYIMKILHQEGFGSDCSSLPELLLSEKCGIVGDEIMFSSNDTPVEDYIKARELDATINLDDFSHIDFLEKHAGIPELISFRYNPGKLREGNFIIGDPEESKYGFTREQIFEGFKKIREKGAKRFGVHTFIASNELDPQYFVDTAAMLFDLAISLKNEIDIHLEFINLSGGIGIPYDPKDEAVDLEYVGQGVKKLYEEMIVPNRLHPLKIFSEYGRMVTGPYGYLVSEVKHMKDTYRQYVGLDACMANLMRPGVYGAYHHITVVNKENVPADHVYDVTGSLCENNDKFAINRNLPQVEIGDLMVIHDAGAHGHSMGFNYNGKLRSAELLLRPSGEILEIRRAETIADYFATLDFEAYNRFRP
ncbi:MAG: diaminopimelate decarboxylase [Deltaproteobacteria bacterium]|jgi:diaminopimelate decarboxylase|nr:diaminopimelate decarboxylase [Deltaproteobacteria bacterium]MBT4266000.1 diaminopimelate decarboxylase [Deltaproteobacteria bacterium]MBT4644597.1 diaminopimelate decarboxylase [Deltaproteobacteria bacterium]MBT6501571.1 diaminopimelate decarboxylase [Deltaproteobacteria bacterium]MBT6612771.1 diaminopimelate decarboxylase [Deltaproteobacteria bacterium]